MAGWLARWLTTPGRRIAAAAIMIDLCVLVIVAVALESGYEDHRQRSIVVSRNTSRLVAQTIAGDIDRIDLQLLAAADAAERAVAAGQPLSGPEMEKTLLRLEQSLPMVGGLVVTDAAGEPRVGTLAGVSGAIVADRAYFKRLSDTADAGLIISEPLDGRIPNTWKLVFARRLSGPDGRFAGIVLAPVPIDWFVARFATLDVGRNGAVALRGDSGRGFDLIARFPQAGFVGQTTVSDRFRETVKVFPAFGTYEARAGADDIRRIFTYCAVGDYPLITLVGIATLDYLRSWWGEAAKLIALAALFVAFTTAGGLWMARAWRELERRTDDLGRSNADLEQFAYVASHDLQTPLRNVASYAQLLSRRYRGRLDSDADEFIDFIVAGAKQMSQMISDILDYARVSASERPLEAVDTRRVVDRVLSQFAGRIAEAGAEIRTGWLPPVQVDEAQVISLFQNLLDNALTYRVPGRAPLIELRAEAAGTGWWRFQVADNGIGIDPAYHDKIFVIFQRLAPVQFPGGTGIGLALCRRIVERAGGRIGLDSTPGQGTRIHFTLPGPPGAASEGGFAAA